MKRILLLAAILAAVTFWTACNQEQTPQSSLVNSNGQMVPPDDQYWAKNNFDLQRVGDLVQRSRSPEEFERYLNRPGGIDNLDLNGDGYADYISVREFDDLNNPNCRGLSMYTQYGPDQIQEIGTVMFYRDGPQYPGARILLRGDPRIYGDNYYYDSNWLDNSLGFVSFLFGGNRDLYSTPYYYDNYPTWYQAYDVVETPVYQTRVVELYPQPVVVYTTQPDFVDKINIRSPNDGRYYPQVHAMLAQPTREQEDFIKKDPRPDHMVKAERNAKTDEVNPAGRPENEKPAKAESQLRAERPNAQPEAKQPRPETPRAERIKIARAASPRPARANNPGNSGHVARPAPMRSAPVRSAPARPAPAGKPARAPSGGGGVNRGNGGGKLAGGGKPNGGGKPAGGGGKQGGGKKPGGGQKP